MQVLSVINALKTSKAPEHIGLAELCWNNQGNLVPITD